MFFYLATRVNKIFGTTKICRNKIFSVYKWRDVPAKTCTNRVNERDSLEAKICHIAAESHEEPFIDHNVLFFELTVTDPPGLSGLLAYLHLYSGRSECTCSIEISL